MPEGRDPDHDDSDETAALLDRLNAAQADIERLEHETAIASAQAQQAAIDAEALREELQLTHAASSAETEALRTQADEATARSRDSAARYRELMLRLEPGLPPDLVEGDTVDEIDASITAARAVAASVRAHMTDQAQSARVPAGAPVRGAPDLSSLTPRQKIAYGLSQRGE